MSIAKLKAQHLEQEREYELQVDVEYPPEIASALSSNEPPSDDALRVVNAFRMEPANALATIESKISAIDAEMESLKKQKESLGNEIVPHLAKLKVCDTIMSPIRRIPFDVLREIALYSMPLHPSPNLSHVPLSAAQVCSIWRAAILSSPRLWTTLFLDVEDVGKLPRYKMLVEEWFKRAKGLPLSFFIYFEDEDGDIEIRDFRTLLETFTPFVPQVCQLGIGGQWVRNILPLFVEMDADWDLRNLERLDLVSGGPEASFYNEDIEFGFPPYMIAPVKMFNRAPLLRKLAIKKEFVENRGVATVLPWSQLTYVELSSEGISVEMWIKIMEMSPQMQGGNFLIRPPSPDENLFLQGPTREHLQLRNLSLGIYYDYPHFVDLIKIFNLPNLRVLELSYDQKMPSEDLPSPKGLKQLSSLRSLVLHDWSYPMYYLIAVLHEAINLEELVLILEEGYTQVLDSLIYTSPSTILPRLTTMKISITSPEILVVDVFVNMIKSRCLNIPSNSQPLKHLFIGLNTPHCSMFEGLKERLRPCMEKGLFLQLDDNSNLPEQWLDPNYFIRPFDNWDRIMQY